MRLTGHTRVLVWGGMALALLLVALAVVLRSALAAGTPQLPNLVADPPNNVFQRLFTTAVGAEETNIERAHVDESSAGETIYVSADGHHHWHLQRVAKYSLWNSAKTAEAAPAQKVGFCLEDSQHVETS